MPRRTIDEKAEMLERASKAEKKADNYSRQMKAYEAAMPDNGGWYAKGLKNSFSKQIDAYKHLKNLALQEADMYKEGAMPTPNSREQYNHEREAGDPNALRLSYEDWKNL